MKHVLILLTSILFAADEKPKAETRPMSAPQELILLRALVVQKHAQLELLTYREQPKVETLQLRVFEVQAKESSDAWKAAIAAAQKADKADGCSANFIPKAEWSCEVPKK